MGGDPPPNRPFWAAGFWLGPVQNRAKSPGPWAPRAGRKGKNWKANQAWKGRWPGGAPTSPGPETGASAWNRRPEAAGLCAPSRGPCWAPKPVRQICPARGLRFCCFSANPIDQGGCPGLRRRSKTKPGLAGWARASSGTAVALPSKLAVAHGLLHGLAPCLRTLLFRAWKGRRSQRPPCHGLLRAATGCPAPSNDFPIGKGSPSGAPA